MRKLYWLLVLLTLTFCKGPGRELSPREYYILGRDALLAQDYENAVDYFRRSVTAAASNGNYYYEGYACLQLATLCAQEDDHALALDYALKATDCLEVCGELVAACLSRLEAASQYIYMGKDTMARAQVDFVHEAFPSPESPIASRLDSLYALIEDCAKRKKGW